MLNLGFIAFAQPWLLVALGALPVLWFLLRVTPPSPRRLSFPAIRLLAGLRTPEETPARTPLWLLLLRMLIAALIVLALTQPLLHPSGTLPGSGPLVLVIDDGWGAARQWQTRIETADQLLQRAEREGRAAVLVTTAPGSQGEVPEAQGPLPAGEVRRSVQSLQPKPWEPDRAATLENLQSLTLEGSANVVWLADGIEPPVDTTAADGQTDAASFADALRRFGRLDVLREEGAGLPHLLLPPEGAGLSLLIRAARGSKLQGDNVVVVATGEDGQFIGRSVLTFEPGEEFAEQSLDLPTELRNRVARLQIEGETTAGAAVLLDERWRRRPVGLISSGPEDEAQPLLSELYYLERALEPFTELRRGNVGELLGRELAVLILPDSIGGLGEAEWNQIANWVEQGGLLLRFAGPRIANAADGLLPVSLRGGDRILGGAMTWDRPAQLGPFQNESPFRGLTVPNDVTVQRQVLAEPTLDLGEKTWARLADGTPLVTGEASGEGWLVLIHTTANTEWSNLSISGLFVEMLARMLEISQGVTSQSQADETLAPLEVMDGFGNLETPAATVFPLEPGKGDAVIGPRNPPGYYGQAGTRRAHNLGSVRGELRAFGPMPSGITVGAYGGAQELDLKPFLLAIALALVALDLLATLALKGLLTARRSDAKAAVRSLFALILVSGLWVASDAEAQDTVDEARTLEATLQTRLAYVITGSNLVDETSEQGLMGLTTVLQRRTSIEAAAPLSVDLERDELGFFPLIYWPITEEQTPLSDAVIEKVNLYLVNGGTILFDLREPGGGASVPGQSSPRSQFLQQLTFGVEIPPLSPVPPDHVLTKSFYLMQEFPGRYAGGTVWIESGDEQINDGVTSIIIGSNDWAGAWAVNQYGQPLNAVIPGGTRQREMAYRFGVNLVMYALTGNYKADQVHVPFILERLGQ